MVARLDGFLAGATPNVHCLATKWPIEPENPPWPRLHVLIASSAPGRGPQAYSYESACHYPHDKWESLGWNNPLNQWSYFTLLISAHMSVPLVDFIIYLEPKTDGYLPGQIFLSNSLTWSVSLLSHRLIEVISAVRNTATHTLHDPLPIVRILFEVWQWYGSRVHGAPTIDSPQRNPSFHCHLKPETFWLWKDF